MLGDDSNLRHPESYELSSLPVAAHDEEALVGRRLLVEATPHTVHALAL